MVVDGLSERPLPELDGKTPLEKARTPNLDLLAKEGVCGEISPFWFSEQKYPRSDTAHLGLFGYDPRKYYLNRGPYEAAGIGVNLEKGDLALRANFGTVDENLKVIDRRAGRISKTEPLAEALAEIKEIRGVKFFLTKSWGHRAILVMRGENLSDKIEDPDPHEVNVKVGKVKPLQKEADFTASVLTEYLERAHQILKKHPLNKERELPGNYLLVRGAGKIKETPSFQEMHNLKAVCIAGGALYKGIAKILRMDLIEVEGANGLPDTNIEGKFQKAKEVLNNNEYDFVFLHVKATDSLAESGKYKEKTDFIERMDKKIPALFGIKDSLIAVTADHCTCCKLKRHCIGDVPLLISGNGKDSVENFSEKDCKEGKLGKIKSLDFMKKFLTLGQL